jgi:hypothetical protein
VHVEHHVQRIGDEGRLLHVYLEKAGSLPSVEQDLLEVLPAQLPIQREAEIGKLDRHPVTLKALLL